MTNQPDFLPDEFRFAHDYAFLLHDRLTYLLVEGERTGLFLTHFSLDQVEEADRPENFPHIFDWFEKYDRGDLLGEVLLKAVLPALLSDFCHFIFEALTCSRKGKLTVAYALLRKPLRENLHYIEWLLADPADFLNTLYAKESVALSFSHIGQPDKVKAVVAAALARCANRGALDAELLYELRYDREFPDGFDGMCNQAMHLITTKPPIATIKQNFNFIFSNDEDRYAQWEQMYRYLPLLLFYATEVVESLVTVIGKRPMQDYRRATIQRSIGFVAWARDVVQWDENAVPADEDYDAGIECPGCAAEVPPGRDQLMMLIYDGQVSCPHCSLEFGLDELAGGETG
ncbi:hypothetical protein [Lysobacter changpingensis]|uniref:hypothetical protein n=1 Tax=Lysobacter changpingensis TaxID=2792784 RepID=UPI001A8C16C4|nr:hypothetical protein [Lysobacter changpingensis]